MCPAAPCSQTPCWPLAACSGISTTRTCCLVWAQRGLSGKRHRTECSHMRGRAPTAHQPQRTHVHLLLRQKWQGQSLAAAPSLWRQGLPCRLPSLQLLLLPAHARGCTRTCTGACCAPTRSKTQPEPPPPLTWLRARLLVSASPAAPCTLAIAGLPKGTVCDAL